MIKRGNRRAQTVFGLSYEVIFSILIIIFTLAVAFFAIKSFLSADKCVDVASFFTSFQDEVDKAWSSQIYNRDITQTTVSHLPKEFTYVCFGSLESVPTSQSDNAKKSELEPVYINSNSNMFLYPLSEVCDGRRGSYNLEHAVVRNNEFFCVPLANGLPKARLEKKSTESLVNIIPPV